MREIIIEFVQMLSTHFAGKTVGSGGDFGASLTNGPFDITAYFHQWQDIVNPSIHVQIIQESPIGTNLQCCGGVTRLALNVRISVDQKGHGWSIAMALYEELRNWLCDEVNYKLAPQVGATPDSDECYLVFVDMDGITADHVYEGDVFSLHVKVNLTYLRRFES